MHIERIKQAARKLELVPNLLNTGDERPAARIDGIFTSNLWKDILKEYESSFSAKKECSRRARSKYLSSRQYFSSERSQSYSYFPIIESHESL